MPWSRIIITGLLLLIGAQRGGTAGVRLRDLALFPAHATTSWSATDSW